MRRSSFLLCSVSGFALLAGSGSARATYFASSVISYTPGDVNPFVQAYEDPTSALGSPAGLSGIGTPYQNVLSPFSSAFDTDQVAVVGEGGSLTLQLPVPVKTVGGPALGVITTAGLQDESNSDPDVATGTNTNPATIFGGGAGEVDVSQDGSYWVTVNTNFKFNIPANYYLNAGPYDPTPPANPVLADFGKPFTGTLSDFDGKDYADTLALLNGSGGGSWIDLSATGLSEVNFIRFSVAAYTGDPAVDPYNEIPVDAVAENSSLVDLSAVPEPAALGLTAIPLLMLCRRRRRMGVR